MNIEEIRSFTREYRRKCSEIEHLYRERLAAAYLLETGLKPSEVQMVSRLDWHTGTHRIWFEPRKPLDTCVGKEHAEQTKDR